ncbi:MAG: transcriptional repressor [Firmicutes bacterium]|nr:transcriptional repressor [Bacillota bacterium]
MYDYITTSKAHPSAEATYFALKERFPSISLNTVYKTLHLFASLGLITRLTPKGETARFDGNPQPHIHLICQECGQIIDLERENIELSTQEIEEIEKEHDFKVNQQQLFLYGYCTKCNKS